MYVRYVVSDFTRARGMEAALISQRQIRYNLSVRVTGSVLVHIEVDRLQSKSVQVLLVRRAEQSRAERLLTISAETVCVSHVRRGELASC